MENKKEIQIINGDGSNLDISAVSDHINATTPKSHDDSPKNIVIPTEANKNEKLSKKKDSNKKDNLENDKNDNNEKK